MLHPDSYPHIFDAIAASASRDTLLSLRCVCHGAAAAADAILFRRAVLVLDWAGSVYLEAEGGPRLTPNLRDYPQSSRSPQSPRSFSARFQSISPRLPPIRHLTLAGAFEFGCIPSLPAVHALIASMQLHTLTLHPDPYARVWAGTGAFILDLEAETEGVHEIWRPPTPPPSSPYEKKEYKEYPPSPLILRRHAARGAAHLPLPGRVTLLLSHWSPAWSSGRAARAARVSCAQGEAQLVKWRYAAAVEFVAHALDHSHTHVVVRGLECVHAAYLDHAWVADYTALEMFRARVAAVRDKERGWRPTPVVAPLTPDESVLPGLATGLEDYFDTAAALDRLCDYSSSRSSSRVGADLDRLPSPSPAACMFLPASAGMRPCPE